MGFSEAERLVQGDRVNFNLKFHRINWTANHMAQCIRVTVVLIHNVLATLHYHLAHETVHILTPPEDVTIEQLRATRTHTFSTFQTTQRFNADSSDMIPAADILASYQRAED
jgi:hypothetical protein